VSWFVRLALENAILAAVGVSSGGVLAFLCHGQVLRNGLTANWESWFPTSELSRLLDFEAAWGIGPLPGRTSNCLSEVGNLIVDALDSDSQVQSLRILIEHVNQWLSFRF